MTEHTLKDWLHIATPAERNELAESCGTSGAYLQQLASGHRGNPKLKLAMCLVATIAKMHLDSDKRLPLVSLEALAQGPVAEDELV